MRRKEKKYRLGNIIYEGECLNGVRDGKGKEYNLWNYELEYDGGYLNGKWSGFGKKYYKGVLDYEGEYLNGQRNGKGKEYNYKGKLIFEGEYLNGKKWNGKGYDNQGNPIFEIKNGKGDVREYNWSSGKLVFEGEYLNGERDGKGKEYYDNGEIIFEGE